MRRKRRRTRHRSGLPNERGKSRVLRSNEQDLRNCFRPCSSHSPWHSDSAGRGSELGAGDSTEGIVRKKAFESETAIVSQSKVAPGVVSGWHHHGTRQLYGFIVSGRLRLEYFLRRQEIADLNVGDFFHIPAGLVHRDLNPRKDRELVVD